MLRSAHWIIFNWHISRWYLQWMEYLFFIKLIIQLIYNLIFYYVIYIIFHALFLLIYSYCMIKCKYIIFKVKFLLQDLQILYIILRKSLLGLQTLHDYVCCSSALREVWWVIDQSAVCNQRPSLSREWRCIFRQAKWSGESVGHDEWTCWNCR